MLRMCSVAAVVLDMLHILQHTEHRSAQHTPGSAHSVQHVAARSMGRHGVENVSLCVHVCRGAH